MIGPIAPLVLPLDLRVLYRWHDGHEPRTPEGSAPVFFDEFFLPLAEAVRVYHSWMQVNEMWNPLWFPGFGGQQFGSLVTLGRSADQLAGPLWHFHYHEPSVASAFDSILSLISTAIATWRDQDVSDIEQVDPTNAIHHEHNPLSITPSGEPRRRLGMYNTQGWPQDWLDAAGVGPMEADDDELVISVAEFLRQPRFDRTLRGTLVLRSGSGDWTYGRLTGATGSMEVLLLSDRTENYRQVTGGGSS